MQKHKKEEKETQTGPLIDLRREKPHHAMQTLKKKQNRNYNDRLADLKHREKEVMDKANSHGIPPEKLRGFIRTMEQIQQAHRIYAREQRRFNKTYDEVWVLFALVFERWESNAVRVP